MAYGLAFASIFHSFTVTHAHVVWVDPAPRPSNDVKNYPCGGGSVWDVGPITDLQVGTNEVIFDEFVCHAGDMARIAIAMHNDDGYDNHVLLDRLPHNDQCNRRLDNNLMAVNITIPDVDCVNNECSLQVMQVMSSKFPESSCENPGGISQSCGDRGFMYFSCARVRIPGTLSEMPRQFADFYGAEAPVAYKWPLATEWTQDASTDIWRLSDGWQDPKAVVIEPASSETPPVELNVADTPEVAENVADTTPATPEAAESSATTAMQSRSTLTTGIGTAILCSTFTLMWSI